MILFSYVVKRLDIFINMAYTIDVPRGTYYESR